MGGHFKTAGPVPGNLVAIVVYNKINLFYVVHCVVLVASMSNAQSHCTVGPSRRLRRTPDAEPG